MRSSGEAFATILRRTAGGPHRTPDGKTEGQANGVLLLADLRLDTSRHEVHRAGECIPLSPTEFNLFAYPMTNAGRMLRRLQIVEHVWHYDFAGDTRIIETYVKCLRRKVDCFDPPLIHTVRGASMGFVKEIGLRSGGPAGSMAGCRICCGMTSGTSLTLT